MPQSRLIVLSGPSGVGKTPLDTSLYKFFPEIRNHLRKIVLYNSRKPRPGEKDNRDYHFRSRKYLNQLRKNNDYIVIDVRGDTQALNLIELTQLLENHRVLFEGNTCIAIEILKRFKSNLKTGLLSIFLSPLSKIEIQLIQKFKGRTNLHHLITTLMYNKLERRLRTYGTTLSSDRRENLNVRSKEAYFELKNAWRFDWVIPNHDGEDSDNWRIMPYPIGDARISLHTFVDIIQKGYSENAEKWEKNLIP